MVQAADVLGCTAVKTGNGRISVGAIVTGSGKAEIYTGNIGIKGGLRGEHLVHGIGVGVDGRYIQITHAGSHHCGGSKDTEYIFDGFHFRNAD